MLDFAAKIPTIPIPFHKLLKVVALVDGGNPQTRALLELISAEKFEVEISETPSLVVSKTTLPAKPKIVVLPGRLF